jgi:glucose/arabinose dehydrogenase
LVVVLALFAAALIAAESDHYKLVTLPVPDGVRLEVSGLEKLPGGRIAIATRNGDVWFAGNVYDADPARVDYHRFASGLHEPLGLAFREGALFLMQRSELTRLRDTDGDGLADEYATIAKGWGVTGNYHEYAYGPKFTRDGMMWVTLNQTIGEKIMRDDRWRGWSLLVRPDGSWTPMSAGMRSPSGLGFNAAGDPFYTDQQGNWVPTNSLHHMRKGAFHGHPESLRDAVRPESPVKAPARIPAGIPIPEAAKEIPGLLPAVWFPYRKMGMSATDVVLDDTGGRFGPFNGQLFVGDFTLSLVMRVFLEKVDGQYQGACFPFRQGFDSAVVRMVFGADGSMFAGLTNRGWHSLGTRSFGLQRLVFTGKTPFDLKSMESHANGFDLEFTLPVSAKDASAAASYSMSSYTYLYHATYGSPAILERTLRIASAKQTAPTRVRLEIEGLREGFVHELNFPGVRSVSGEPPLHDAAYYTLNRIRREPERLDRVGALH